MNSTTSSKGRNASTTNQTSDRDDDQLYSFEDIQVYTRCEWLGNLGWVMDKGEHLCPAVPNAEHLYIEYKNENGERDTVNVRKELVNKFLKMRNKLWVDFNDHLYPNGTVNDEVQ